MGHGYFSGKPWLDNSGWTSWQIGQCRLHINLQRTQEFYALQPKITDNCKCDDCRYYETVVINEPHYLFDFLKKLNVDLSRQPNINPDGICCVGETRPGKVGYIGYYFVYGIIGKTSKKTRKVDDEGNVTEVSFNEMEYGMYTQLTIKQVEPEKLSWEFYVEVDKAAG